MARKRDTQRARVYAFERAAHGSALWRGTLGSIDEVVAYLTPIWRAERGRYGKPKRPLPMVRANSGNRASGSEILFNRWGRNPWVMLHEMAHALVPADRHGPRFVGCLIGLLCRHFGQDRDRLLAIAYEHGVRVNVGSIGAVPKSAASLVERVYRALPGRPVEIAMRVNAENGTAVGHSSVRGAALNLVRSGRARWRGRTLVAVVDRAAA